jgi:hypothetical protein
VHPNAGPTEETGVKPFNLEVVGPLDPIGPSHCDDDRTKTVSGNQFSAGIESGRLRPVTADQSPGMVICGAKRLAPGRGSKP